MRIFSVFIIIVFCLFSCKKITNSDSTVSTNFKEISYKNYGKTIDSNAIILAKLMAEDYMLMRQGDSLDSKIKGIVKKVCQTKGCWMTLNLDEDKEVMVKFKEYGFFVPRDIAGKEVIISGKAFVKEVPLEELKHYAEDAGKSAEEIALILEPKRTFSFEADGVLIANEVETSSN